MDTEVVIPWMAGCPYREAALYYIVEKYAATGWPVRVAKSTATPWVKANAVTPAVMDTDADFVIVADADVWSDDLPAAVDAVRAGAPWAIPHLHVHRLNEQATSAVIAGKPHHDPGLAEKPYKGHAGGGIVVLPRSTYLQAPLDPRFQGWGQEDDAWAMALNAIAGRPWRGTGPLVHLWHPPQPRRNRRVGSQANLRLLGRYQRARTAPDAMRALIEEARLAAP